MQREACAPTNRDFCQQGYEWGTRRRRTYLDLQGIISTDSLAMHLMVGIVGIAAVFILHERKAVCRSAQLLVQSGGRKSGRLGGAEGGVWRLGERDLSYSLLEAERGAGMSQRTKRP